MTRHLLVLVAALLCHTPELHAGLRASVARADITPDNSVWLMGYAARKSTGTLDHIFHKVVVLDDGVSKLVLAASDLCVFSPVVYDDMAREVEKRFAVPRTHFWWTVTHTHAAPEVGPPGIYKSLLGRSDHEWDREYTAHMNQALLTAIAEAMSKLEPATLAIGTGFSAANINRRARDADGTISLGINPDGPVDRQIGLIRLDGAAGKTIALIANYAMHGTVMSGQNLLISGDAPGIVASHVEKAIGAPMLYINGAAGDLAPIYSVYPNARAGHLGEFRVLLGDRILEANRHLREAPADLRIQARELVAHTARRAGLEWPGDLSRYGEAARDSVALPLRMLRLGDLAVWGAPVEMFCEIALRVRSASPFPQTFYFGYTNGWLGYLPTKAAFAEGGYEPKTSILTDQAAEDVTRAALAGLAELRAAR